MIEKPHFIAPEDVAAEPQIDIAVVEQALPRERGLGVERARVEIEIETRREAPDLGAARDGTDRKHADAVNGTWGEPDPDQEHGRTSRRTLSIT